MDLSKLIRNIPDFPKQGILFRDVTTLLKDKHGYRELIDRIAEGLKGYEIDIVVGPEARGFILGSAVAYAIGAALVPARKAHKLPCDFVSVNYGLEYGEETLAIHTDAIEPGQRIAVVDDLLATGGTAKAVCELCERLGGNVVATRFAIELCELEGRTLLRGYDVESVIKY